MPFPESRKTVPLLSGVTATGTGATQALPPGKKQFQLTQATSTGTATSGIECSVDGSNWVRVYTQSVAAATGNNIFETESDVPFWRGNVTSGSANFSVSLVAGWWPANAAN